MLAGEIYSFCQMKPLWKLNKGENAWVYVWVNLYIPENLIWKIFKIYLFLSFTLELTQVQIWLQIHWYWHYTLIYLIFTGIALG